ncbi:MAG: septum formation protein Maf [Thermomicrobiales bacterium]|nr:septum formation protein Maf [Thermomicrobiales bacterium]
MVTDARPRSQPDLMLASGSPRRRELFARLGEPFTVEPSDVAEDAEPGLAPERLVLMLAERKARAVAARHAGAAALIVGGDTVVSLYGRILGKPADDADAVAMLERLSGRSHEVWTGVAVVDAATGRVERAAVPSVVRFAELTPARIAAYVASGEGRDKAGGYAIQGQAGDLVVAVHGCWANIVGLPVCETAELLRRFGRAISGPEPICQRPDGSACPRLER